MIDNIMLSVDKVVVFLCQNLEFFQQCFDLLELMCLLDLCGLVVLLLECQVVILCECNQELCEWFNGLIDVVRENDQLFEYICCLILVLLEVCSIDKLLCQLLCSLEEEFCCDIVVLLLYDWEVKLFGEVCKQVCFVDLDDLLQLLVLLLCIGKVVCGVLCGEEFQVLFQDQVEQVCFVVVVLLEYNGCFGIFVIGSCDVMYFCSFMGILFIIYIGQVFSCWLVDVSWLVLLCQV